MNIGPAELTIDGVRLGTEFGIEIVERDQLLDVSHAEFVIPTEREVWLTRRVALKGPYERVKRLLPSSQITAQGDGWSMECNGQGEGVYRTSINPMDVRRSSTIPPDARD